MSPVHPLARVAARLGTGEAVVAGVLSGTSADGIDVALARFPEAAAAPRLASFVTLPFPETLAGRVRACLDGERLGPRELALLSRDLGRAFGRAARDEAARAGLRLDLVGSHGQTIWHHDGAESSGPATLQLGDGDFVAAESGALSVSDFRQADVAAGGEGAPLSALVDPLLYAEAERPCAILNLGGMANLTLLGEGDELLAFDTGPAGSLLDGLARRLLGREFDAGGDCAARGRVSEGLLAELLGHPFLDRAPPKSTGRDTFGEAWVEEVIHSARGRGVFVGGDPADLFATAVELVSTSVGQAFERFASEPPRRLVVAGGGAENRALMRALERCTGLEPLPSEALGVPGEAREALVFCVLAARFVLGLPSTRTEATGARRGALLGKLSVPAPGGIDFRQSPDSVAATDPSG